MDEGVWSRERLLIYPSLINKDNYPQYAVLLPFLYLNLSLSPCRGDPPAGTIQRPYQSACFLKNVGISYSSSSIIGAASR